jgi:hypothetical protein
VDERSITEHFFQSFRPIGLEELAECAISEQPALVLANCAVIRFVLGVHNALDGLSAVRTRLAEFPVGRKVWSERCDLTPVRELPFEFHAQSLSPLRQRFSDSKKQPLDLIARKCLRQT